MDNIILLLSGIALIFLIFLFINFIYAKVPGLPSYKKDISRIFKLADIKPGQKFYDLGCGHGRMVFEAMNLGADATGFEISFLPYIIAKTRLLFSKNKKSGQIKFKNFWKADLSDADVIYIFLMPNIHKKAILLKEKIKPKTKIIAYVWPIEGWEPKSVSEIEGHPKIYLYEK